MTIIRNSEVTRPTVTPLRSSILDVATVKDRSEHFALVNEAGLWPSYNCMEMLNSTEMCPDPTEDKTEFLSAPWTPAFSFAVYGAVQCNLVGLDRDDQKSEVRRVFEAQEGLGIERALKANRFVTREFDATAPTHRQVEWDGAVDLTPSTANAPDGINLKIALAILEGYAAIHYAGQPTIHMPRAAISLISDMVVWEGNIARTPAGSKIAVGGGYDDESFPLTGKLDLYATGEVYIEKGPITEVQTFELTGDTTDTPFDSNTSVALVERPYRAAVDCFVAKATGTLWP